MKMDIVFWMTYGFFSFYTSGSFLGLRDTNLKTFALIGLGLGCITELTGKNIVELISRK
jgi:hypothetical protein